jgi:hypothetical protein
MHRRTRILAGVSLLTIAPDLVAYGRETARYVIDANTVTDPKAGLVWQREVSVVLTLSWADAKVYCAGSAGGTLPGTGWRLPTVKELQSLFTFKPTPAWGPFIDEAAFSFGSNVHWSSTPLAGSSSESWVVFFALADTFTLPQSATEVARCVRPR